jgi:hypothetical protein
MVKNEGRRQNEFEVASGLLLLHRPNVRRVDRRKYKLHNMNK